MMNDVLPFRLPDPPAPAGPPAVVRINLYGALLADAGNPRTQRARTQDVADLARFLGLADDPGSAAELLVSGTAGQANAIALGYGRHLRDRGLAAATVNRRLSTVRRLVKLARRLGLIDWAVDVEGMKAQPYRDTSGPGADGWRRLLETAQAAGDGAKARRDRALLRLMHDNALRRSEVVALDVADLDLEGSRVAVVGKGQTERRWLTLNAPTVAALRDWLAARGEGTGPLFLNFHAAGPGRRLSGDGLHEVVRALGRKAGLGRAVRPHGLRHQGITRALELTGGNLRMVQKFSRHKDANTVQIYDDNREDLAGRVAELLGRDG
jgi:integrase/recombinase XerC